MRSTVVKHELAVGAFVAVALGVAGWTVLAKTRERGLLDSKRVVFVVPHGRGLEPGAPVLMKGIQVGEVSAVELTPEAQVRVTCRLAPQFGASVREDATASIVEPPLLGATKVELAPGTAAAPAAAGQSLGTREAPNLLAKVDEIQAKVDGVVGKVDRFLGDAEGTIESARAAVEGVQRVVDRIDRGEGLVARLINDPAMAEDAARALATAREVAEAIKEGEGAIGMAVNDPEFADDLKGAAAGVREVVDELDRGEGTLGKLLRSPEMHDEATGLVTDVRGAVARLEELNREAQQSAARLNALLESSTRAVNNVDALVGNAARVSDELADTLHRVNQGQGTVAAFLNDDAVYRETRSLLKELRESVEDLREQAPINSFIGVVFSAF